MALVAVTAGIPPIARKAILTMKRVQFDTNCLMLFASLGALALQDFVEAGTIVFLFALSEWLEVRATIRARRALSAIVDRRPEVANVLHPFTKEPISVTALSVPVGSLIMVRTGEKIPCDGTIVQGCSTVDESSLTGESRPIKKNPSDAVSGGTVNSGKTPLVIRTNATSENSAIARLIKLVEEAQANRDKEDKITKIVFMKSPVIYLFSDNSENF